MTKPKSYWKEIEQKYGHLGDSVWCKECHKCFQFLGAHIKIHGLTENEYKDKHELLRGLPLCTENLSNVFSEHTLYLRQEGIHATTETFVNSKRNAGITHPQAARKSIATHTINRGLKNRPVVTCDYCNKEYRMIRKRQRESKRKFCSQECYFMHIKSNQP